MAPRRLESERTGFSRKVRANLGRCNTAPNAAVGSLVAKAISLVLLCVCLYAVRLPLARKFAPSNAPGGHPIRVRSTRELTHPRSGQPCALRPPSSKRFFALLCAVLISDKAQPASGQVAKPRHSGAARENASDFWMTVPRNAPAPRFPGSAPRPRNDELRFVTNQVRASPG